MRHVALKYPEYALTLRRDLAPVAAEEGRELFG
jgi:hypothetical protein